MKALTSYGSKAISERLGVQVLHVSDRPEFCFSLRFRNDRKGSNFWLLKLVQNKGYYPVHALPAKTQVDLEAAEPQVAQSEQINESKFVRVAFQLQKDCDFGEQFLIVGDHPILGSWEPTEALPMTWSDGHVWTIELDMPVGESILFKFILKGKEGDIIWQPGSDRVINTWETMNKIIVFEDWENAELQEIIEEDQFSQSNEKPQDNSEVLISAEILNNPPEALESNEKPQDNSEVLISAEILNNPQEDLESNVSQTSGIQDIQTDAEEKPLAEPVLQHLTSVSSSSSIEKPMAMVAENIDSSEDFVESTSHQKDIRNMIQQNEESANSPRNDVVIHHLGRNGNAAPLKNQEGTIAERSLFDFEGGPVLVPGLVPPSEEAGPGEVEEKTTMGPSVEALETQDQNIPEFSEEQELNDDKPQEVNATIHDDPELLDNEHEEQFHLASAMEDRSRSDPVYGNPLQNDIQWGREKQGARI
ncbi:uncharacterized protein LOC130749274 isoform X2 [Lotus japonicus]|uniref:uncharacterized protein LOC130749274 isoform X2 n=1 Tax=Lotus japonicus TaxID=34305 RepID=UPI00258398E8|nr:uncharacterized protein LOC130749274 isoform X2 [Lotus japonicus]